MCCSFQQKGLGHERDAWVGSCRLGGLTSRGVVARNSGVFFGADALKRGLLREWCSARARLYRGQRQSHLLGGVPRHSVKFVRLA
jgi:hypothetical protein